MTTLFEWTPITRADALDRLEPCYNNPAAILDELQAAHMTAPGTHAPEVRTPYRIIRWNSTLETFETRLLT